MIPGSPSVGEGVLSPNPVQADKLFERMGELTADLILKGPSLDSLDWYQLLQDDSDDGDAAK